MPKIKAEILLKIKKKKFGCGSNSFATTQYNFLRLQQKPPKFGAFYATAATGTRRYGIKAMPNCFGGIFMPEFGLP